MLDTAVKVMPTMDYNIQTEDGRRGWIGEWFAHENDDSMTPVAQPIRTQFMDETKVFIRFVLSYHVLNINH